MKAPFIDGIHPPGARTRPGGTARGHFAKKTLAHTLSSARADEKERRTYFLLLLLLDCAGLCILDDGLGRLRPDPLADVGVIRPAFCAALLEAAGHK